MVFVTIAHIFHNFDVSFDNMNEEVGRADGLLKLSPQRAPLGSQLIRLRGNRFKYEYKDLYRLPRFLQLSQWQYALRIQYCLKLFASAKNF